MIRTGPVQALEVDSYANLRSRAVVGNELEHDHIPSFAALRTAKEAELDRALTPAEKQDLYNNSTALESPRDVHLDSRSYGGRNTPQQIQLDASDLNAAAQRDLGRLRTNLLSRGYDPASVEQAINNVVKRNADLGIGVKK